MSQEIELSTLLNALQVQEANNTKLSFCSSKKTSKVAAWIAEISSAPTSEIAVTLYTCLPEIASLKVAVPIRQEMLETVRATTQQTINNLTREVMNRPINLSKEAQKSVIIAQALQKRMIDGYARCVADLCQVKRLKPAQLDALGQAIHRTITGIGLIFFRSYQLYTQPPVGFWLRLHTLFRIALYFDIHTLPVQDLDLSSQASNIQTAYLRVLLMATAKLNQINQKDLTQIFAALEIWAQFARLQSTPKSDKETTYIVDTERDMAPVYHQQANEPLKDSTLCISLSMLVGLLAKHSPTLQTSNTANTDNLETTLKIPLGFPVSLLDHLIQCWSSISQRQQERRNVNTEAEITIGLVNTHYFVSGSQTFDEFTGSDNLLNQPIISSLTKEEKQEPAKLPPSYNVSIQNISSGGCCLLWKEEAPPKLQAGELVGLKEKGRHIWSVGVIRWIRQFKGYAQLGIQILSNQPKPWGAGQMFEMGGYSDYMRALYIPASSRAKRPATMITANVPFKDQDKVKIFDGDNTFSARLNGLVFSTGAIQQFLYHPLDVNEPMGDQPFEKQGFDENWD